MKTSGVIQELHLAGEEPRVVFDKILELILRRSGSQYGFIGRIFDMDRNPWLRTYAITDISWSEETRTFYEMNVVKGVRVS